MNARAFLAPQSSPNYNPMTGLTFLLSTAIALVQGASAADWTALAAQTASPAAQEAAPLPEPETIEPAQQPGVETEAEPEQAPQTDGVMEREPQRPAEIELARVAAWFDALDTLQARFEQVGADGSVTAGDLYLDRPGRVRFDYDDPTPILLVADGSTVAIADFDLETVDRAPIGRTPFKWLLDEDLDPETSDAVSDIARHDGALYLTLIDPEGETDGRVTLIFEDRDMSAAPETMRLAGWIAVDSMGGFTEVGLSGNQRDIRLNPRLFVLDDDPFGNTRRGRR